VIKIIFKNIVDRYVNCQFCAAVMFVGDVVLLRWIWKSNPGKSRLFFFCISSGYKNYRGNNINSQLDSTIIMLLITSISSTFVGR